MEDKLHLWPEKGEKQGFYRSYWCMSSEDHKK